MEDNINIIFVRSTRRADLAKIRSDLCQIAEAEATYLFRLARRMRAHGCSEESIIKCKEEAWQLHMTGYPERLISDRCVWEYAFKI